MIFYIFPKLLNRSDYNIFKPQRFYSILKFSLRLALSPRNGFKFHKQHFTWNQYDRVRNPAQKPRSFELGYLSPSHLLNRLIWNRKNATLWIVMFQTIIIVKPFYTFCLNFCFVHSFNFFWSRVQHTAKARYCWVYKVMLQGCNLKIVFSIYHVIKYNDTLL